MWIRAGVSVMQFGWLCAAFSLWLAGEVAAAQSVVRIGGSRSGTGSMQRLAQTFMRTHPEVGVEVEPSFGTAGGVRALIAGRLDIAITDRPPTNAELAKLPLRSVEYARTPVVIAVRNDLGVTALTSSQLAGLYGPGVVRYPNGARARPVMRPFDSNDTEELKGFSNEVAAAVEAASQRPGMLYADTDSDAADLVERTPGAFAGIALALIESEHRSMTALVIDGKVPSVAHLLDGSYPSGKSLYMVDRIGAGANTRAFEAFVRSVEGSAQLRTNGQAPL